jgi:hypothetical protein
LLHVGSMLQLSMLRTLHHDNKVQTVVGYLSRETRQSPSLSSHHRVSIESMAQLKAGFVSSRHSILVNTTCGEILSSDAGANEERM